MRDAGLRLGVGEVERLRRVFALRPDFTGEEAGRRLKSLLRAVVVKSREERDDFERVVDAWLERADLDELATHKDWRPGPRIRPHRRRRLRWLVAAALTLVVAVAASVYFVATRQPAAAPEVVEPVPPPEAPPPPEDQLPSAPAELDFSWLETPEPAWTGWPALGLGILSLVTAGGLWASLRRRRWLPPPAPPPSRPGPPRAFLPPPAPPRGPELLDARQQETLVWGIDSFVAEELTRRLDLPATVRATAKAAGLPRLCFRQARYHREVWLWVDEAADDPMIARPVHVDALLRQLSHWPRLAFVDFSGGATELPRLLGRHALDVIAPDELAAFLGTSTAPAPGAPLRASGDDRVWAAACALVPSSVDERSALELRRRLGFETSPWALRLLRAEARGAPGRLEWRPSDRVRLVNWLGEAEGGGVTPEHTLAQALDSWEERCGAALEAQEQASPACRRLVMERALLRLWRQPREAARELYELFGGVLEEEIRRHLAGMAPRGWDDGGRIRLPWDWHELQADARVMLREMGLGGGMPPESLQRPGRLWLGVGLSVGLAAGAFGVAASRPAPECEPVERIDPVTQIPFVRMCSGTFLMGSPESEVGRFDDEGPVHEVTLSEFWIGRHEVTDEEYGKLDPDRGGWTKLPVTNVDWHEARAFCERFGYQLPTEAQWEYAARAGTTTRWSFGDDEDELERFGWFVGNSDGEAQPVERLSPNPWGLYDMHGNVWEWTADWLGTYPLVAMLDPTGPPEGTDRVLRGGSRADAPGGLRSACRLGIHPAGRGRGNGFRCVHVARRQP